MNNVKNIARKKTVVVTETTRVEVSEDQIAETLLACFGMKGGECIFDVSSAGFLRGASLVLTETSDRADK